MKVTNKYSICLDKRQSDIFIDVMQGDTYTRELEFSLYSGDVAWPVPSTASVAVAYSGTGGKGIYDTLPDGTDACKVDGNVVTAILVPQIMAVAGRTTVSLLLADENGNQLTTFSVVFRVAKNPAEGAAASGDYVNILNWTQAAMATLTAELYAKLDQHVEYLSQNFCYVAEDDGDGNVTLKPFHLGGFTDETLSKSGIPADAAKVSEALAGKAPAGFGLGDTFSKVYSFEEADNLKSPGWYLVNVEEACSINGEQVSGIQVVRVDGTDQENCGCKQTWIENLEHPALCRQYNCYAGKWGDFYSITPSRIFGRVSATNEKYEGAQVYCVLIYVGTVNSGESVETVLDIDALNPIIEIIPSGRFIHPQIDMPGAKETFTSYGSSGIRAMVSSSAVIDDTDGDNEADTVTGYQSYLTVYNDTENPLEVCCLLKFIDSAFDWL